MIDSTFGHPLPASHGQEEEAVAVGEWQLFSAGRTEAAVLSELYQNCIILNFNVSPLPFRPSQEKSPLQ